MSTISVESMTFLEERRDRLAAKKVYQGGHKALNSESSLILNAISCPSLLECTVDITASIYFAKLHFRDASWDFQERRVPLKVIINLSYFIHVSISYTTLPKCSILSVECLPQCRRVLDMKLFLLYDKRISFLFLPPSLLLSLPFSLSISV